MIDSRSEPIFHLVPSDALRAGLHEGRYTPEALASDGFVHCSLEGSVLPVADDYYSGVEGPLLLLEIDPSKLTAETRYEAPAPIPGGGRVHLENATVFPHVYGAIEVEAIVRVGELVRSGGRYAWPERFEALVDYLDRGAP